MASDWATLKTHEILYRSNNMADCYDRVAQALREARAEGIEQAAVKVDEWGDWELENQNGASSALLGQVADAIRVLKVEAGEEAKDA